VQRQLLPLAHLQQRDVRKGRVDLSPPIGADNLVPFEVDLLGHLQRVVDLDAEVSKCALRLPVSEEELAYANRVL
jgi:hypothetical protein